MTAATLANVQPVETGKKKTGLKKVLKYFQDQAAQNSNPRSYLTPPGLEPQQKLAASGRRLPQSQRIDHIVVHRRLSEATTAVESRRQHARRYEGMAGDGADSGVFHEVVSPTSKEMKKVQYAQENILQNYRIYVPERNTETTAGDQFWIIYIHGGYFRDPKVDALSFRSALEILTAEDESGPRQSGSLSTVPESEEPSPVSSRSPFAAEYDLVRRHVAGYASINYRLSPHTGYPQTDQTENYVQRNARFPDQLGDVHAALRHLQTRHDITSNYILAGHSVGATLAFLAALKAVDGQIDPPACIVGLNGIYDFPGIHETNPDYEMMTKNAMDIDQYQAASPALHAEADYLNILPKQILNVLLSHSRDDGLVDWNQLETMQKHLQSNAHDPRLQLDMIETHGQHDAIWKEGRELARSLVKALEMVTLQ